jgi:hypothetical protein
MSDDNNDKIVICVVSGEITVAAIKAIKRLDKSIGMRATAMGMMEFNAPHGMSENDRHAWENIIRGIVFVM